MSATDVFLGESELAGRMRAHDWSATGLGPVSAWPTGLRAAVRMVLTSRFAMWMGWGDDLAFLYNDAYRRDTLGAKHPWALGQPTREVWHEIWDVVGPRIATVLETGVATWDEGLMLMLERNGYPEETYHTFSYSPVHDDVGRVRGVLCIVVEETERVISERRVALLGRLAAEIARGGSIETVLGGLPGSLARDARDLPFTLTYLFEDDAARLVSTSGFIGAPLSWAPDALRALRASGDAQPDVSPLPPGAWPTGPWSGPPAQVAIIPLPQQGSQAPAGVIIAGLNPHRVYDAPYRELLALVGGQVAAGLANARANDAERRRAESLAELDRVKTTFFSNVSHEFRTPLTLMLGPLAALLDDELEEPQRRELETVYRNGQRLQKLVNTMLDFSRLEAGRAKAQLQPVDLAYVTADLASVFRAAIEKAGLRFVVDAPPLEVAALVDLDMWEKIVLNLLSNALKFTLQGEIAVRVARLGDQLVMSVADTGTGMPAAELPHVFERFHRIEGAVGRTHEGSGIGLALVKELVQLHGGAVAVQSEVGRGSTFTVTLPVAATAVAARPPSHVRLADTFTSEAMRWLPGNIDETVVVPASRQHLLVADDNADMRAYLRRLLGARWSVETVANGHDALAAIARRRPDLVISDVMMPGLDGFGLVASIRADAGLRDLPVVMLSARAGEASRIEGLQAGATDYIVKPFAARELVARIETLLLAAAVRAAEQWQWRRLATILEQAPVAIAILNGPTHVFEIANAHTLRMMGGRPLVGITLAAALPELVQRGFVELLDGVYRTGQPYVGNAIPIDLAEHRVYDLIFQPMLDAAGHIVGVGVVGYDVTALATARREAETANRAKDEFLAMLGHELRNPLAPILTALELIRSRVPELDREHAVIDRQVRHVVGLVDDLMDVSRITRGKVELRKECVEVAAIIARSIEQASPLFEQHAHALAVDVAPGVFVLADPQRLAQVITNLLTNAAKYTPSGGKIAVELRVAGAEVVITVRDNGIGIDPAMVQRVFEPFAQGRQSIDRAQGGLGLGLAIVANLVKLHGGTISVASAGRGTGSAFTLRLPHDDAPAVAAPIEVAADLGSARILVVDDNVDAAELLSDLLQLGGYETRAAYDGPRALIEAATFKPQIAVLDLGLPVMDGFELAQRMHALLPHARLVALTGYGQADDRAKTASAGFAAHLVKPVDIKKLRATIAQLLTTEKS